MNDTGAGTSVDADVNADSGVDVGPIAAGVSVLVSGQEQRQDQWKRSRRRRARPGLVGGSGVVNKCKVDIQMNNHTESQIMLKNTVLIIKSRPVCCDDDVSSAGQFWTNLH